MSLLDDARRLERNPWAPLAEGMVCFYCRLMSQDEAHTTDCPVRSLPQIVAALEAAQDVVNSYSPIRSWADVMLKLEAALADRTCPPDR